MTRYQDAHALRRAIEARLRQQADASGTDLGRLHRRIAFDRLAARLAAVPEPAWVLKGGAALEFRLLDRARATRDIDLLLRTTQPDTASIRALLEDALAHDPDQDGFVFRVGPPRHHAPAAGGAAGWRLSVEVLLAGKTFAKVHLDVVARAEELALTEQVPLPGTLAFADVPPRSMETVDRRQHFAEKLHALTRELGDRVNTRVKDLVDLILLIETGLAADRALVAVVRHVFRVRGTHALPTELTAPAEWRESYPTLAGGLTETPPDLGAAMRLLQSFWVTAEADMPALDGTSAG